MIHADRQNRLEAQVQSKRWYARGLDTYWLERFCLTGNGRDSVQL